MLVSAFRFTIYFFLQRFGIYMPETVNTPVETDLFVISMTEVNDVRADIVVSELTLTYKQAQVSSITLVI